MFRILPGALAALLLVVQTAQAATAQNAAPVNPADPGGATQSGKAARTNTARSRNTEADLAKQICRSRRAHPLPGDPPCTL